MVVVAQTTVVVFVNEASKERNVNFQSKFQTNVMYVFDKFFEMI